MLSRRRVELRRVVLRMAIVQLKQNVLTAWRVYTVSCQHARRVSMTRVFNEWCAFVCRCRLLGDNMPFLKPYLTRPSTTFPEQRLEHQNHPELSPCDRFGSSRTGFEEVEGIRCAGRSSAACCGGDTNGDVVRRVDCVASDCGVQSM